MSIAHMIVAGVIVNAAEKLENDAQATLNNVENLELRATTIESAIDLKLTYLECMSELNELANKRPDVRRAFRNAGFSPVQALRHEVTPDKVSTLYETKKLNATYKDEIADLSSAHGDLVRRADEITTVVNVFRPV